MLILGEPGTGKSTLLLELALQLVKQAEVDASQPLPILLPLSSWAVKRPPLQTWIVEQLDQLYDIPRQVSEQWVREEVLLPLLDGLDEMEENARPACIAAINAYHHAHLVVPLVVCSRKTEYEAAAVQQRLTLQCAVVVQPLTREQVDAYLLQGGEPLLALRNALKQNLALYSLATTPLMLSVLLLTYQGTTVRDLSRKEMILQQQVWEDYVKRMVERKGDIGRYPLATTCTWLGWLARQMREHNQVVFYLEHLQSDWLPANTRAFYTWVAVRLPALIIGIFVALAIQLFFTGGIDAPSLQYGLLGGFLGWLWTALVPQEDIAVSLKREKRFAWGIHLAVSVFVGLFFALSLGFPVQYGGLILGAAMGLGCLLLQRLFARASEQILSTSDPSTLQAPHLRRFLQTVSARCALLTAAVLGLSYGLSYGVNDVLDYGSGPLTSKLGDGLTIGLLSGLSYGLSAGLICLLMGLIPEIQAGTIRLAERLRWMPGSLKRSLLAPPHLRRALFLTCLTTLLMGLSIALGNGLYNGVRVGLSNGLIDGLSNGLIDGLIIGLNYWLLFGLFQGIAQERIEDQDRRVANQGIRRSLRNSLLMGFIGGVIIGIVGTLIVALGTGLSYVLDYRLSVGPSSGSTFDLISILSYGPQVGICGGCFVWLLSGGLAVLRHYVIRFLLWRSRTFPRRAVAFLDDATARVLLRRIGGGYSFTHRLLLDHFADLSSVPMDHERVSP